jgi:hypothetical protein
MDQLEKAVAQLNYLSGPPPSWLRRPVLSMKDTPELPKLNVHIGYQPRAIDGFQKSSIAPTTRP